MFLVKHRLFGTLAALLVAAAGASLLSTLPVGEAEPAVRAAPSGLVALAAPGVESAIGRAAP